MEKKLEIIPVEGIGKSSRKIDIHFENVWLTVKQGGEFKKIVKGVFGTFKSGELTAIMGPSGAGKTSLLNILTGYQVIGVEGAIKCSVDGKMKKGTLQYKNESCYILQDDHLPDFFTVYELMRSTVKLKKANISEQSTKYLIEDILNTIGLYTCKSTRCGNLSGGQRKRLSIALELIDDPPVLFLDEPTTGLDSSSSAQCILMLQALAEKGRTIVCTVHQPSAPLYSVFNQVYAMAAGKCVYQGAPSNTVPYLKTVGFICPQYHNPADYLLEVANGEFGNAIDTLSKASQDKQWRIGEVKPHTAQLIKRISDIRQETKLSLYEQNLERHPPLEIYRFLVLLKKQLVYLNRDWTVTRLKLLLHLLVGIFLGVNFQKCGYDGSKTITNISFYMCSVVYLSYTSLMPAALRFPSELKILRKEHFNRWYKLKTFFLSHMLTDIPVQILSTLAYISPSYVISSQPLEWYRFTMAFMMLSAVGITSSGMGLFFGALANPINGTFLGAITTALMFSFGGFLCLFPHMSAFMYFITNLSFMSFAMEGLLQAMYGFNRDRLTCPEEEPYCLYSSPEELLKDVGMNKLTFWADFGWVVVYAVAFRILAYWALRRQLKGS